MTRYRRKARKFLMHNVLHADDTPHRIALGVGLATLVAFLPLIGVQTVIAVALAAMFRANKVVCIPVVWITNPITWLPVYGACSALGRVLLPASASAAEQTAALEELSSSGGISQFFSLAFWGDLFGRLTNLSAELWLGCALVGIVGGIVAYFASRWAVVAYREKHKHVIARRRARIFRAKARRARRATREPA